MVFLNNIFLQHSQPKSSGLLGYFNLYLKTNRKLFQPEALLFIFAVSIGVFITCVVLIDFQDENEDILDDDEANNQ